MPSLKLCTYNLEWMTAFFGARKDTDWLARPEIVPRFAGKVTPGVRLAPIADVTALCRRVADSIRALAPDILFIQEGPPLAEQMALFVKRFLDDDYVVHRSNRSDQAIHALVRRRLAARVQPWLPADSSAADLWRNVPYYPWGAISESDRKTHHLARHPLLLRATLAPGQDLIVCGVHTKSKFSLLKTRAQWNARALHPGPVLDALASRQKLSAEIARLRGVLASIVAAGPSQANLVVLGDFNDGPFRDLMEQEFLTKSILDELVGSFLEPNTYFQHAMPPQRLASASSTRFADPLQGGAQVHELIDHVLVSAGIWSGRGAYRVAPDSCVVETQAWQQGVSGDPDAARENRPSDHQPVSVVLQW